MGRPEFKPSSPALKLTVLVHDSAIVFEGLNHLLCTSNILTSIRGKKSSWFNVCTHTCILVSLMHMKSKVCLFVFTNTLLPYILVSILFKNAGHDPSNTFHSPLKGHDLHFEKHSSECSDICLWYLFTTFLFGQKHMSRYEKVLRWSALT